MVVTNSSFRQWTGELMAIPADVRKSIRKTVFARADDYDYMRRSRPENQRFIQSLTNDPLVGGRLADFMPREKVRTYIKDAILNAYAKTKNYENQSINYLQEISNALGSDAELIEAGGSTRTPLIIAKTQDGRLVVAKVGTVLKWETAVRHVAESLVNSNASNAKGEIVRMILLRGDGAGINGGDANLLRRAAQVLGFHVVTM